MFENIKLKIFCLFENSSKIVFIKYKNIDKINNVRKCLNSVVFHLSTDDKRVVYEKTTLLLTLVCRSHNKALKSDRE